jgi:hypothetical protein
MTTPRARNGQFTNDQREAFAAGLVGAIQHNQGKHGRIIAALGHAGPPARQYHLELGLATEDRVTAEKRLRAAKRALAECEGILD